MPAGGGRTIFALPWLGRTLVGTTDNDYEGELDHVRPAEEDVAYLLEAVNAYFGTSLGLRDVTGAYAGVRPLISTGDPKKSVDISRKAELYETSSAWSRSPAASSPPGAGWRSWRSTGSWSATAARRPAAPHDPVGQWRWTGDLPAVEGVDEGAARAWPRRYGHAAHDVLEVAAAAPRLAGRISPDLPDLLAEAVFAARREQARSVADVLLRRTRLGLLDARELSATDAPGPARWPGRWAGSWAGTSARVARELSAWRRGGARPRGSCPAAPAAAARAGARARSPPVRGAALEETADRC